MCGNTEFESVKNTVRDGHAPSPLMPRQWQIRMWNKATCEPHCMLVCAHWETAPTAELVFPKVCASVCVCVCVCVFEGSSRKQPSLLQLKVNLTHHQMVSQGQFKVLSETDRHVFKHLLGYQHMHVPKVLSEGVWKWEKPQSWVYVSLSALFTELLVAVLRKKC